MYTTVSGNPLMPGIGLTDPHVFVDQDTAWLFATHDASPSNRQFVMNDWWVWASSDLVQWRHVNTLKPEQTYLKRAFSDCWASFGVRHHGSWFWYLSVGPTEIGVVTADDPADSWRDPIGRPLIPKGLTPTDQRDPDILIDQDGTAYIVFGTWNYFIARLGDDMVSLAELPRPVVIHNPAGPYGPGRTDDKPSLHRRGDLYYLSWSSFYAISDCVYGPYDYVGSVLDAQHVEPIFRRRTLHHDRHGNFFEFHGQWYYICNDKNLPGRTEFFRDSCIGTVQYRNNGYIAPVRLTRTGVGQYDACSTIIEAEDYMIGSGARVAEHTGGFAAELMKAGSWIQFPRLYNAADRRQMALRYRNATSTAVQLEIRAVGSHGPAKPVLTRVYLPVTGTRYRTLYIPVRWTGPCHDLQLTAIDTGGVYIDWIRFING